MKTAVYLRVSTDAQDEDRQRKAIRAYIREKGLGLPPSDLWFMDKESRDLSHKRPEFQRMIRLAENGEIGTILIDRLDRFGVQDADEWFFYRHRLHSAGCKLISVDRGEDLTAKDAATMVTTMFGAVTSEREQVEKSCRVLGGRMAKAKDHACWNGGRAPYGYDKACYDATGTLLWVFHYLSRSHGVQVYPCEGCRAKERGLTGNGPCPTCRRVARSKKGADILRKAKSETIRLVPSEDQSRIDFVRQVFAWYTGLAVGFCGVAARCVEAGHTLHGFLITHEAIKAILTNPAYIGDYAFGRMSRGRFHDYDGAKPVGVPPGPGGKREIRSARRPAGAWVCKPGQWLPLIDRTIWEKAQRKLKERATAPRPPRGPDCWLKGILHCGKCRKPMATMRKGGRTIYFCLTYHREQQYRMPRTCDHNAVLHPEAEKIVLDYLAGMKVDLTTGTDSEAILRLYAMRGLKEDLLAETVRKGAQVYTERIREAFGRDEGNLAGLIGRLQAAFNLMASSSNRAEGPCSAPWRSRPASTPSSEGTSSDSPHWRGRPWLQAKTSPPWSPRSSRRRGRRPGAGSTP